MAASSALRIGIEDRGYQSLIQHLAEEGHQLFVYVDGVPFDALWPMKNVTYVRERNDLLNTKVDFVISSDFPDSNVRTGAIYKNMPVIGHAREAIELELDRDLAFSFVQMLQHKKLVTPPFIEFRDREEAINFLSSKAQKSKSWVMKQHRDSPLDESDNRTVITHGKQDGHANAINLLKLDKSPWFDEGVGGVRFEKFIEGVEVCFGAMFSESYPEPNQAYWCREYKDAQNGDRSGVLTGEVGTLIGVLPGDSVISDIFSRIGACLRSCKVLTTGMIDFNTIIDSKGTMHFIEFTVRWGRPTLETQLAMIGTKRRLLGDALFNAAIGLPTKMPYENNSFALGVTVYDYGLPYTLSIPGRKGQPFKPPVPSSPLESVQPLFCNPSDPKKWISSASEGRHFVSIGLCHDSLMDVIDYKSRLDSARELLLQKAYSPLRDFKAPGMTWRDDIGKNMDTVIDAVKRVIR